LGVDVGVGEDDESGDAVSLGVTETAAVACGVAVAAATTGSVGAGECELPMRTRPPSAKHATRSTTTTATITRGPRADRASARLAAALARRDSLGSMPGILRLL